MKLNLNNLRSFNDTVFVTTNNNLYFIDSTFNLNKYPKAYPYEYGYPDLEDSQYNVYSCGGGEWHGSVFFWNKKNRKLYSYPCTQVQQVIRFREKYVVSNSLAHMDGFSNYLIIDDPKLLYEIKEEYRYECNWYRIVDSLKNKNEEDYYKKLPKGVKYLENPYGTVLLNTFVHEDALYSITVTDSATVLNKISDNKLIPLDTLFNKRINFTSTITNTTSSKIVKTYSRSWTREENGKRIEGNTAGLVYINGRHLDFVEFITPTIQNSTSEDGQADKR